MTTLTNQQGHMYADAISQSLPPAWTIWTCRSIHLTSWQHWWWWTKQRTATTTITARSHRSPQNCHRYRRPKEHEHLPQLGDVLHDDGRQLVLLRWWKPEKIFFAFNYYPTAAASKTKTQIEPGNVLSKRRGVSQHVCEACGQIIPSTKDIPGPSTKY